MITRPQIGSVFLAALMASSPAAAQIDVGPNVQVSQELDDLAHAELLIAAAPADASRLLGCSMVFDPEANAWSTVVYTSTDGGRHWEAALRPQGFARSGDPACAFGPDGSAYFVDMSTRPDGDRFLPVYRSADGGSSWSPPMLIPNRFHGIDREYIVVDNGSGPRRGRVYLHGSGWMRDMAGPRKAGDLTLFHSTDGGRSFHGPVKRGSFAERYVLGVGNGVVLSDGTFVAVFGELKDYWTADAAGRVRENEEGRSNALLKAVISRDGGRSLEQAVTVADFYMDWPPRRTSSVPYIAADPGSPAFKDRLYVVWPDKRSGRLEIVLSWSGDGGATWSQPRVVNDDPPVASGRGTDHFLPAVAVNDRGVVGVMWYDRRNAPDGLGWTVRFTASLDGGETFLPSVPVSEAPNAYGDSDRWVVQGSVRAADRENHPLQVEFTVHGFHFNGGHTAGMAASADGVFHPFWIDNRTGVAQAWSAPVAVEGEVARNGSSRLASFDDVSSRVRLRLADVVLDARRETVSARAWLENESDRLIRGPLVARVLELRSELGRVRAADTDNGASGEGAIWQFRTPSEGLAPGSATDGRILRFRLSELRAPTPLPNPKYGLVRIRARILAPAADSFATQGNE